LTQAGASIASVGGAGLAVVASSTGTATRDPGEHVGDLLLILLRGEVGHGGQGVLIAREPSDDQLVVGVVQGEVLRRDKLRERQTIRARSALEERSSGREIGGIVFAARLIGSIAATIEKHPALLIGRPGASGGRVSTTIHIRSLVDEHLVLALERGSNRSQTYERLKLERECGR